jgi:uracil-DNA glycosylase
MPWTERQHALLQAMGLRVWSAPAGGTPAAAEPPGAAAPPSPAHVSSGLPTAVHTRPPAPPPAAKTEAPPAAPQAVAASVRSDLATLGWTALREAVAGCRACGLCQSRTQTVFGVGHEQAHWMVVGEAPGENEDREGEPFVGAAGQLLDRMLAALQLSRAADGAPERCVYIANTLKCRPPRNRNPGPQEMAQCEPFLVRQIELLRPRLILAMGRFAVQALLRSDEPIGRLRGRVHRYQGVPLVVTYHPAYLLRSPLDKARAWDDLCLADATVEAGTA